MKIKKVFWVYLQRILWQFGCMQAGQSLIKALGDEDYSVRVIAGMSLIQGGERAFPLLCDALSRHYAIENVIQVLADIGDESAIPMIEPYCKSDDSEIARAANSAIRLLMKARST